MIVYHHERRDGTGYPSGLKAYAIPFGARVIAVVDRFEARSQIAPTAKPSQQIRRYKPFWLDAALSEITRLSMLL